MDFRLSAYKQWAPEASKWSAWVKPVLFSTLTGLEPMLIDNESMPSVDWAPPARWTTALIVDMPGHQAVYYGLALINKGYRPIPLFNGCKAAGMVVNVTRMAELLAAGSELVAAGVSADAPPAFLLDSNRMDGQGGDMVGKFDNRWCILAQDMPSAKFMKAAGVEKIILLSTTSHIKHDLEIIASSYQKAGIQLQLCKPNGSVSDYTIRRWPGFGVISQRWAAIREYKRNTAGGFGATVTAPLFDLDADSNSSHYYYRSSSRMG